MSFIPLCWNIFVELLNLFGVGGLILSHYWIRVATVWKWNCGDELYVCDDFGELGCALSAGSQGWGVKCEWMTSLCTHLSDAWISTHDYNQDACLYFECSESAQVLWNVAESGFWTFLWRKRLISSMSLRIKFEMMWLLNLTSPGVRIHFSLKMKSNGPQ